MNIKNAFITAFRALGKNKMRSALTSVGIIIGISSVIIMVGMGNSARFAVRQKIFSYGANGMRVISTVHRIPFTDLVTLKRNYPEIRYITPHMDMRDALVRYKDQDTKSELFGVSNDFLRIKNRKVVLGREFSQRDVRSNAKVAIIGETIRKALFPKSNPIGKKILASGVPLTIIGVMNIAGEELTGRDFDNWLLVPYTTADASIFHGTGAIVKLNLSTYTGPQVTTVYNILRKYYRRKHNILPGQEDDIQIKTSEEKLKMANEISGMLSMLLAGIASISLFVGGVGIMNIMLVSVTERTREIGIRMAIGAKKGDIMVQFLIESIILSTAGGIVGILLGLAGYYVIVVATEWPFMFSFSSIAISVAFATVVGVFFGYYPSKKAAGLKPIDALKFE